MKRKQLVPLAIILAVLAGLVLLQQSGKELAAKFSQIFAETPRLKTGPYVFEQILESRK